MSKPVISIPEAIERYKRGEFLIVVDDLDRENEGDLMLLADKATPEKVAFMVRYTTGILCVALTRSRARELELPLMVENNEDVRRTAFTVAVDYAPGITTGVSASERARTINALSNVSTSPRELIRPGHIYPLVAHDQVLRGRQGHTEAGVALSQLSGSSEHALLSEIVNFDGSMARGVTLEAFADEHQIPIIAIADLTQYYVENFTAIDTKAFEFEWADLPINDRMWKVATYSALRQREHVVLSLHPEIKAAPTYIRIHSECFTGDVLGSQRCDCGDQLALAQQAIVEQGSGYIIYLRNHEGRGIGLSEKIKAYRLQDEGLDTVDANLALGHQVDSREWSDAIEIIKELGLNSVVVMTNNPEKVQALIDAGISTKVMSLDVQENVFNQKYLDTKATKLGHQRPGR
ncbi:MAG: 3,4-dihydroxy-2-butanone-4-phosphate synthase [Candidatus Planktophila sp.]